MKKEAVSTAQAYQPNNAKFSPTLTAKTTPPKEKSLAAKVSVKETSRNSQLD
jgi:hypothetical protein